MYLASFNHKGRDLIGIRWGTDQLLVLETPASAASTSTAALTASASSTFAADPPSSTASASASAASTSSELAPTASPSSAPASTAATSSPSASTAPAAGTPASAAPAPTASPSTASAAGALSITDAMLALITAGAETLATLARAALSTRPPTDASLIPISEITWHPPIRRPGKIVGVAMNNSASDARKISAPRHPMFFLKPRSSLLGHLQELEIRSYYGSVHPEPELAVVIGKRARDLDPRHALDCVFGYTIMNDVTGNAMRGQDMVHYYALYASESDSTKVEKREQHLSYAARYKGTDGFAPLGPWLVTRDEVPNPGELDVICKVGSEVVAEDSTRYLTYSVPEILAFLSRFQTLEPGDVISMGTAFRQQAGAKRSLHSADLQRVDGPMQVEITGLGSLVTPVRRRQMELGDWQLPKS